MENNHINFLSGVNFNSEFVQFYINISIAVSLAYNKINLMDETLEEFKSHLNKTFQNFKLDPFNLNTIEQLENFLSEYFSNPDFWNKNLEYKYFSIARIYIIKKIKKAYSHLKNTSNNSQIVSNIKRKLIHILKIASINNSNQKSQRIIINMPDLNPAVLEISHNFDINNVKDYLLNLVKTFSNFLTEINLILPDLKLNNNIKIPDLILTLKLNTSLIIRKVKKEGIEKIFYIIIYMLVWCSDIIESIFKLI